MGDGTTSVVIDYIQNSPDITVSILGNSNLVSGLNTINFQVFHNEYGIMENFFQTINVLLGNDTSLASLTINGIYVSPDGNLFVPFGTTQVDVNVVTNNPNATVVKYNWDQLLTGSNKIDVVVTAEDTTTITTYAYYVIVPTSSLTDTSLATLTIDGISMSPDGSISKPFGTSQVDVNVVPSNPNATVVKNNWDQLSVGSNKIDVVVTSQDFQKSTSYAFFVNVEPDPSCFNEGTKILTDKGYILIEKLKVGDMIKTLKNGFLPIHLIGKSNLYNLSYKQRIKDQLYVYSQPELLENLILTGGHSILVDDYK